MSSRERCFFWLGYLRFACAIAVFSCARLLCLDLPTHTYAYHFTWEQGRWTKAALGGEGDEEDNDEDNADDDDDDDDDDDAADDDDDDDADADADAAPADDVRGGWRGGPNSWYIKGWSTTTRDLSEKYSSCLRQLSWFLMLRARPASLVSGFVMFCLRGLGRDGQFGLSLIFAPGWPHRWQLIPLHHSSSSSGHKEKTKRYNKGSCPQSNSNWSFAED